MSARKEERRHACRQQRASHDIRCTASRYAKWCIMIEGCVKWCIMIESCAEAVLTIVWLGRVGVGTSLQEHLGDAQPAGRARYTERSVSVRHACRRPSNKKIALPSISGRKSISAPERLQGSLYATHSNAHS